jgi:hypothetical protein
VGRRKFCDVKCRKNWHRRQKNPEIDANGRVPPRTTITGDPEIDKILKLNTATTLQNTLLKDYLERRDERVRREALEGAEKWKEERVLDDATAKKIARFLAKDCYTP